MSEIAAVVLAAGSGTRLLPLTTLRAKALCPVANVPLVDRAIDHVRSMTPHVAVNARYMADQMVAHLRDGSVHLSVEDRDLSTAGAFGKLKTWIDGRAVLVHNADSWHRFGLRPLIDGWDGHSIRLASRRVQDGGDFADRKYLGIGLIPFEYLREIPERRAGLYELILEPAWLRREIEFVDFDGEWFDCGTPRSYLAANLFASGGVTVVGPDATVLGDATECVLWGGTTVGPEESLYRCIRASNELTVQVAM